MGYGEVARSHMRRDGANCSQSVTIAYAEKLGITEEEAMMIAPEPRSIDGKCGAVLAAEMILDKLGVDKKEEFDKTFLDSNKSLQCKPLLETKKARNKSCHDMVEEAADILEKLLDN